MQFWYLWGRSQCVVGLETIDETLQGDLTRLSSNHRLLSKYLQFVSPQSASRDPGMDIRYIADTAIMHYSEQCHGH
jgi:hypothetical protein